MLIFIKITQVRCLSENERFNLSSSDWQKWLSIQNDPIILVSIEEKETGKEGFIMFLTFQNTLVIYVVQQSVSCSSSTISMRDRFRLFIQPNWFRASFEGPI